jgi:hypothetical protein
MGSVTEQSNERNGQMMTRVTRQTLLQLVILCIVSFTVACDRMGKVGHDPVADMKSVVAKFSDPYWADMAYDVQKTESLVSPYVGIITGHYQQRDNGRLEYDAKFKVTMAYQDGKWVLKDIDGAGTIYYGSGLGSETKPLMESTITLIKRCVR